MVISDVTWFLERRGWGSFPLVVVSVDVVAFSCGFWGYMNVVVFPLWFLGMRGRDLSLWFLGTRGRGSLSLGRDFRRHVIVVVFLGPWFLMRGRGGFSFGRSSWRYVDVVVFLCVSWGRVDEVVFPWVVVSGDAWKGGGLSLGRGFFVDVAVSCCGSWGRVDVGGLFLGP